MVFLRFIVELITEFFKSTLKKEEAIVMTQKEITMIPKYKEKSENVKAVQTALNTKGFKLTVDGIYGPVTKAAISKFQKANKLTGSGNLGPQTIALLNIKLKVVEPIKLVIPNASKEFSKKFLVGASNELGVKEAAGAANNPRVVEYHKFSTKANKQGWGDSAPWCSSFVCFIVENFGAIESTNNGLARSWEKWVEGKKIDLMKGLPGDIVVFWRTSLASGYGHVGFFLKETKDYVWVLGGNQSDEVNITRYSKERVRGYFRHKDDASSKAELIGLANKVLNGQKISLGTKVV
jgi:uncharacterized protein (TIGR02594 family)